MFAFTSAMPDFTSFLGAHPGQGLLQSIQRCGQSAARAAQGALYVPFDGMRTQYAAAVNLGLIERSLLASARFEQQVDALEKLALGPLARRV